MTLQEYNDIFKDSPTKQIKITTSSELEIENENIISESMSLEGSLYSEQKMRFGSCEATCFNVTIADINHDFTGEWLTVTMSVDGIENPLNIGRFKVFSDKPTNDRRWRELTCYDAMNDIINSNVKSWFDNLTFPMTIKNLRDSLFTELGITQVTTTLVNDNFSTEGEFYVDGTVSAKDILVSICELNGVFGHINTNGQFEYIDLTNAETLTYDWYIDGTGSYEDYVTDTITGIIARASDEDVGTTVGTTTNPYVIQNNPLVFGKEGTTELETALTNLLTKISTVSFRPFSVETYGNPMLPLGTQITLNTRDKAIVSYVMRKYMSGIQGLKDNISASATQKQENYVNSIQSKITRTGGKIHKVVSEVDRLESEIIDFEQEVSSSITQLSSEIVLKVQSDGSLALVQLGADPSTGETAFVVKAGNFSVDAAGNVVITGNITAKSKLTMRNAGNISGDYFNTDVMKITYEEEAPLGHPVLNLEKIEICDYQGNPHVEFRRSFSSPYGAMYIHDAIYTDKLIQVSSDAFFRGYVNKDYVESGVSYYGHPAFMALSSESLSYIEGAKGYAGFNFNKSTTSSACWTPAICFNTYGGNSWQIGNYNNSNIEFVFATEANIASQTNTVQKISLVPGNGTIAHSGNVGTGDSNGQIKIAGTNVSVKGLGSRAYDSTAYVAASGGTFTGGVTFNTAPTIKSGINIGLNAYSAGSTTQTGALELYNGNYVLIDFHWKYSSSDWTFRITQHAADTLEFYGHDASTWGTLKAKAFSVQSSIHVKENIEDITEEEASKLLQLRPVSFDYKNSETKNQRGLIAEEVLEIYPEMVEIPEGYTEFDPNDPSIAPSIDYAKFVPYLIKFTQMQDKKIKSLESRIEKLESIIEKFAIETIINNTTGGEVNE